MLQPPGTSRPRPAAASNRRKPVETPDDIIRSLQRLPANKKCADCSSKLPSCVNLTIGSFVCMTCAGVHRQLNARVKGVGHSSFTAEEAAHMQATDNDKVNQIWMARYQSSGERMKPPTDNQDPVKLKQWIHRKYHDRAWYQDPKSAPQATVVDIPPPAQKQPTEDLFATRTPVRPPPPQQSQPPSHDWDAFGTNGSHPPQQQQQQQQQQQHTQGWDAFGVNATAQPTTAAPGTPVHQQNQQQQPQESWANFAGSGNNSVQQQSSGVLFEANFANFPQSPTTHQAMSNHAIESPAGKQQQFQPATLGHPPQAWNNAESQNMGFANFDNIPAMMSPHGRGPASVPPSPQSTMMMGNTPGYVGQQPQQPQHQHIVQPQLHLPSLSESKTTAMQGADQSTMATLSSGMLGGQPNAVFMVGNNPDYGQQSSQLLQQQQQQQLQQPTGFYTNQIASGLGIEQSTMATGHQGILGQHHAFMMGNNPGLGHQQQHQHHGMAVNTPHGMPGQQSGLHQPMHQPTLQAYQQGLSGQQQPFTMGGNPVFGQQQQPGLVMNQSTGNQGFDQHHTGSVQAGLAGQQHAPVVGMSQGQLYHQPAMDPRNGSGPMPDLSKQYGVAAAPPTTLQPSQQGLAQSPAGNEHGIALQGMVAGAPLDQAIAQQLQAGLSINHGNDSKAALSGESDTNAPPAQSAVLKEKGTARYQSGQKAYYRNTSYMGEAEIIKVHFDDDLQPFYTIIVDGKEKQTDDSHLTPMSNDLLLYEINEALKGLSMEQLQKVQSLIHELTSGSSQKASSLSPSPAVLTVETSRSDERSDPTQQQMHSQSTMSMIAPSTGSATSPGFLPASLEMNASGFSGIPSPKTKSDTLQVSDSLPGPPYATAVTVTPARDPLNTIQHPIHALNQAMPNMQQEGQMFPSSGQQVQHQAFPYSGQPIPNQQFQAVPPEASASKVIDAPVSPKGNPFDFY